MIYSYKMSAVYREKIVDHYKNPRGWGKLKEYTHFGVAQNLSCGDEIRFWIQVDDKDMIKDISFKGEGCVISLSTASMLVKQLKGRKFDQISKLDKSQVVDILGVELRPVRMKCAMISVKAAQESQMGKVVKSGN